MTQPQQSETLVGRYAQWLGAGLGGFVDEYLILPKALYFFLNMAVYAGYTYTPKYFAEAYGIPIHEYGYMSGLSAASFFGSIMWTSLADWSKRHRALLLLASLGYPLAFVALAFPQQLKMAGLPDLFLVCCFFGLASFFISALYPLLDNRILVMLTDDPRFTGELYGRQRLWGVLGQALVTVLNGMGIKLYGHVAMFASVILFSLIFLLIATWGLPSDRRQLAQKPGDGEKPPVSAWSLFSLEFLCFLLVALVAGYSRGILGNFLPYYFDKVAKQDPFVYGIAMQTRIIPEIAIFFFSKQLLARFGSRSLFFGAQLAGTVRALAYAVIPATPRWSLLAFAIELLKGLGNAAFICSGVQLANELAPPQSKALAQGFFSGVYSNLANAAAGLIGGLILQLYRYDPDSMPKLFAITAAVSGLTALLYGITCLCCRYRRIRKASLEPLPTDR